MISKTAIGLIVVAMFAVTAFIVAFIAQFSTTSPSRTKIVAANGFGAANGPDITMRLDVNDGVLAVSNGGLVPAGPQAITSALLTGYAPKTGIISDITSTDSILDAISKLDGVLNELQNLPYFVAYIRQPIEVTFEYPNQFMLIETPNLIPLQDPTGDFTPFFAGAEYNGERTQRFVVKLLYNILPTASVQTYEAFMSKNGSLVPIAQRTMNFTADTPVGYTPFDVSNIYSLSKGDTVQLAAQYTMNGSTKVNMYDMQLQIIPIN